jgi:mobilome CxxCx(11)CxxC protein
MLQERDLEIILQKKTDALATKHLHQRRLGPLEQGNLLIDYLAIAVPILYVPVRYLAKGTGWQEIAEPLWEILAALLLALTALKIVYGWQESIKKHSKLRDENIFLASQADSLLRHVETLTTQSVESFLALADRTEAADREALGTLNSESTPCSRNAWL